MNSSSEHNLSGPPVGQNRVLLYIVSPRYSGSTLLCYMLAAHPDVATIGERKKFWTKVVRPDPWERKCSCGLNFTDCRQWLELLEQVRTQVPAGVLRCDFTQFRFSRINYLHRVIHRVCRRAALGRPLPALGNPFRGWLDQVRRANTILMDAVVRQQGGRVFLDSSKPIDHAVFLRNLPEYELRIIRLTRDARGQVLSAMKYNPWNLAAAAKRWAEENEHIESTLNEMACPIYRLSYEELCRSPECVMPDLFAFAGLPDSGAWQDFGGVAQHIMGNRMRLASPSEIRLDESWREKLAGERLEIVDRIAGRMNERLGYGGTPAHAGV